MNINKLSSALRAPMIVLLVAIMLFATVTPTQAATPVFSIKTVVKDTSVTITAYNFPVGKHFVVRMGEYGTLGVGGVEVGQFDAIAANFVTTFNIPASLAGRARIAIRMDSTTGGYYSYNWFYNDPGAAPAPATPGYSGIPTISVLNVVPGVSVKLRAHNFPPNVDFKVLMGAYGTYGVGGTEAAVLNSLAGGTFDTLDIAIPAALAAMNPIAIRLQSTNGVYYAYNWFTNGVVTPPAPGYTGIPTFSIKTVVVDDEVTILTNNFPAGLDFTARMGAYGTKGVGGPVVGTINSGLGGAFVATFKIPAELKGSSLIAIRLDDAANYYYAYNWFTNSSAPVPPTPPTPAEPIPTVSVSSVVKNTTVTLQTWNFPVGKTFKVTMGEYGTYGVNGIAIAPDFVSTAASESVTFNIPAGLADRQRIAIRLQTEDGKYFSYNWFWNN